MDNPEDDPSSAEPRQEFISFSPGRILTLAFNTLTQLVRMKVFYFLLIFSLVVFFIAFILRDIQLQDEQRLKLLKDIALGAIGLFTSLFAIVATSMLLPKDVEDRTLYTILAKPVPRFEYLVGKLLGMVLLVLISTILMNVLSNAVIFFEKSQLIGRYEETRESVEPGSEQSDEIDARIERISSSGAGINFQYACASLLLKAAVISAMTLLISTFASSSLFTIIVSTAMFIVGHAQSAARDFWLADKAVGTGIEILTALVALIFPDLQLFSVVVDGSVTNQDIPFGYMLELLGISALYVLAYTIASWFVFTEKEL